MKVEELPAVVIKRIGADFSVYIPDNHPDKDVRRLEEKFIAYDIGTDYEGTESYLLIMQTKNSSLSATYNGWEINSRRRIIKMCDCLTVIFQFTELTLTTLSLTTSTYTLKKKVIS
jgi:hypothetical protein